jgi:ATP-dependent Clp protease ATP-binding subunit ClpC
MSLNLSQGSDKVLSIAKSIANSQNTSVSFNHLLIGLLQEGSSKISSILKKNNLDTNYLINIPGINFNPFPNQYSKYIHICLKQAEEISNRFNLEHIEPESIFLALVHVLKSNNNLSFFEKAFTSNVDIKAIEEQIVTLLQEGLLVTTVSSSIPTSIEDFCIDLTLKAEKNELDPLIGRTKELDSIVKSLLRKTKSNILILGEAGFGKTQLVEGLAQLVVSGIYPPLDNTRIVSLDTGALISGTKFRGELEERVALLIKYCKSNPSVILFIDEIHNIVGLGNYEGSLDLSNLLKPALSRGELKCIGATTYREFKLNIEKDKAFTRRFNIIPLEECSKEETLEILRGNRTKYERYHGMIVPDSILKVIVNSSQYITNRNYPDKAIDVLDEAGSKLKIKNKTPNKHLKEYYSLIEEDKYEEVQKFIVNLPELDESLVYETIESITQVPINKNPLDTYNKFKDIESNLRKRVVGQEDIINKISSCIKRSFLYSKLKPRGSFLLCGNTGVGKTYIVKELSKLLLSNPAQFIQIDMSEFQESHSISKLIGSPPGYIGYENQSFIFSNVKNYPFCIILFDEIEKAHPSIYNVLLQILDEGFVTDSVGRKIYFNNSYIFLTTNIGSSYSNSASLGFELSTSNISSNKLSVLKEYFTPEFLNRIDEILPANPLNLISLSSIMALRLEELKEAIKYKLEIEPSVITHLITCKINLNYGAREIGRIVNSIKDLLVDYILTHLDISTLYITIKDKEIHIYHSSN